MYNQLKQLFTKVMNKAKRRVTFFLPDELVETLKIRAIKTRIPSSEIVEEALREYLKKNSK